MWSTTQSSLTRSKMCVRMRCVAAVAFGGGRCPPFDCIRLHQGPHVRTAVNAEADGWLSTAAGVWCARRGRCVRLALKNPEVCELALKPTLWALRRRLLDSVYIRKGARSYHPWLDMIALPVDVEPRS